MKLISLIILVLALIGVDSQSDCEEGGLRVKTRYYFSFPYYTIQVCSNVTGSLDWTYICYDSDWDVNSVNVYCRQLGYLRAENVSSTDTGSYRTTTTYLNGTTKIENVDCKGDEETLLNCVFGTTVSSCHLTEYNPSNHCNNESILQTTSITNSPVDSSTVSTTPTITNSPVDSSTVSTAPITNSPVDSSTVSTAPITNSPVDSSTVSTAPTTNSPVFLNSNSQRNTEQSKSTDATPTENPTSNSNLKTPVSLHIVLPVLVVFIFGSIVLVVVIIITLVCFRSRLMKRKHSSDDSNYYTVPEICDATKRSYNHPIQLSNGIELDRVQNVINGDQDLASSLYASISEQYRSNLDYSVVKSRQLDTEYVDCLQNANANADALYGDMIEGEVGHYSLYEFLPGTNPQAMPYEIISLSNEYAEGASPRFIEPPDNLPELENVFAHCLHEISIKEIDLQKEFAFGQFGVVYRGTYHTQRRDIPVALKTLKEASDTNTKVAFMREAAILAQFQHPNVLRLIGVLTAQQPYMMVTELLKTELSDFLKNIKTSGLLKTENISPLLLKFSTEISAGMEHLSEKHFIHRDLAARSVLVAKDLSCRIADFGMSRELLSDSEYYISSGGRIPLRWTAPEAVFYLKYSEKSDVWSFGMTLFEIWSLGEKPWGNDATNKEITEGLSDGRKLSPPTGCPRDVYSVMVETWRMDSSCRPTFSVILHLLTNIHLSIASPPVSPETDPSLCLGNDPLLARDHYPDLQQVN